MRQTRNVPNVGGRTLHWKYLISTNRMYGMYYELTYNGDKDEWYLDAYRKMDNKVITL